MFRDEWLAFVDGVDPQSPETHIRVQLLVDQRDVIDLEGIPKRHKPVAAWLRVSLAGRSKGLAEIVLPQPAIPVGESTFISGRLLKHEAGT
jgi:hypothetical protein